ncbi:MAG: hypothetical protein EA349_06085 [Halomonadaceae bacterium]|nr:MAG: hypothetical protein EA349_06085 [Halomonadaceae bacterium]
MSLLNDALRDLDERRPGDATANPIPPGLQGNPSANSMVWLLGLALLLVSLLALWFWWHGGSAQESPEGLVQVPLVTVAPQVPAPDPQVSPIAEPVPDRPEPASQVAREPEAAPVTPLERPAESGQEAAPEAPAAAAVAETKEPEIEEPEIEAPTPSVTSSTASTTAASNANVRQLSPQQQEQRAAEAISRQLSQGDIQGATRQAHSRLLLDPEAPQTRAVMARHWLRQQDPRQAREWLPDSIIGAYPDLRLLRARTELMAQQPGRALDWLTRSLPPVSTHSRYHVTLAALQQQLGEHEQAAMTWAALIEYDDARADWWAGLGIALEGQGRNDSARRAFVQASELPGLSNALQNYVQQRLSQPTSSSGSR